ncbi:MAG: hypothetical protein ACREYF_01700 [Gammaproteobacteria bacterium]
MTDPALRAGTFFISQHEFKQLFGLTKNGIRRTPCAHSRAMNPRGYQAARRLAELAWVLDRHPDREKLVKLLPDAEQRQLQALMARRRQLVSMLGSERNRLATSHKVARRSIQAIIKALKRQWEDIEGELARHIGSRLDQVTALDRYHPASFDGKVFSSTTTGTKAFAESLVRAVDSQQL